MHPNKSNILEAQADFAIKLLRNTSTTLHTTLISPAAVGVGLSMALAGAKNETAEQFSKLLANGAPTEEIHRHFGALLQLLAKCRTVESANRIYVQEYFTLLESYKKVLTNHYEGQFESVNFDSRITTIKTINAFVEKATHEKVKNLVQFADLDTASNVVLINAIYFKGAWKEKFFAKKDTVKKSFHISANSLREQEMMTVYENFPYYSDNKVQVLGLPYAEDGVVLYAILPSERFGLSKLIQETNGKTLMSWIENCKSKKQFLEVFFPRFKIESTRHYKDALTKLGLDKAFSDSTADFTGMSKVGRPFINDVIQKASLEVNEEGTEAATATLTRVGEEGQAARGRFFADHPFLFFVTTAQNNILFAGHFSG